MLKDTLFAEPLSNPGDWIFDQQVANVFPDMVQRSIPGYSSIINLIGLLSARVAQPDTQLYDLGCSLGAVTLSMQNNVRAKGCKIIAVDNSTAMLERCRQNLNSQPLSLPVELLAADIRNISIENGSMVVLNFTLQFVPPEDRQQIINRIYQGLQPGGVLVLSEKFRFADQAWNSLLVDIHHDFKKINGYSELQINQKRTMLENVMHTDTLEIHLQRLQQAGFIQSTLWFQCLNFGSLLAIKNQ